MRPVLRARLLALLVAALLVGLTACSGDDGDDGDEGSGSSSGASAADAGPEVPGLAEAWHTTDRAATPRLLTDEVAVYVAGRRIRTVDLASGEDVSRAVLPDRFRETCAVAPQVGRDGVLGLLLKVASEPCTTAAALDTTTGRLRWTRYLPGDPPYHEGRGVDLGDRTLLVTLNCDEVRRFSLDDGRPLGVIAPGDRKCANETATDGEVVAVLADPETSDTPDDLGTGFIPPHAASGAYELYDADSGERLWRRPLADTRGHGLSQVVSSDPLVLATTDGGHTTMRRWSDDGRPGANLGQGVDSYDGVTVVGRADTADGDVLVLSYPDSPDPQRLHGYDPTTGEELWQVDPTGSIPGVAASAHVVGDRLLTTTQTAQGTVLVGRDLDAEVGDDGAPGEPEVLGALPGTVLGVAGDLVLVDSDRLTAVEVPDEPVDGISVDDLEPPLHVGDADWADDDVRPSDATLACQAVGTEALRLAGLDWGRLPTPSDCRWDEHEDPEYANRTLTVSVQASAPGTDDEGDPTSATTAATAYAEQLVDGTIAELDPTHTVLVDGEPTQAWGTFREPGGDSFDGYPVRLVTRWRNVVIDVTAVQAVQIEDRMPGAAPFAQLQDAVYQATADVVSELGGEAVLPERGADGGDDHVDEVRDVCTLLRDEATALVPDQRPYGRRPLDGTSACSWSRGDATLSVLATAVPGALDGASADERAGDVADVLPSVVNAPRRRPGFPGSTQYRRYQDGDYRAFTATTRVGNLVVWVSHTVSDDAPPAEEMDRRLKALVNAVVDANA